MSLAEQIDALLPQTQCQRCSYPACKPYAKAIAAGEAEINQCPPGGEATISALAELLQRPALPLNPEYGKFCPDRIVAIIDEQQCIGCTLCIQACPVDAIIGAAKLMHTVILEECSGCELCLPPCPVDCIELIKAESAPASIQTQWSEQHAKKARQRFQTRQQRLRSKAKKTVRKDPRKALIAAAVARVKQRKQTS